MTSNTTAGSTCLSVEARVDFIRILDLDETNFAQRPATYAQKNGLIAWMSLMLLVGLIANIMVMVWICASKKKKSSVDAYIISLSAADLMVVGFKLPLQIVLLQFDYNWGWFELRDHSLNVEGLCKASLLLTDIVHAVSFATLVVIAIDRYIAICHSLFHYSTRNHKVCKITITLTVVWVISIAASVPYAINGELSHSIDDSSNYHQLGYTDYWEFIRKEIRFVSDEDKMWVESDRVALAPVPGNCSEIFSYRTCGFKRTDEIREIDNDSSIVKFVLFYIIPLLVLTFCYISIIHKLWIIKPVGDALPNQQSQAARKKMKMRNTVTMIVIITTFCILWLPYWIYEMINVHIRRMESDPSSSTTTLPPQSLISTTLSILPNNTIGTMISLRAPNHLLLSSLKSFDVIQEIFSIISSLSIVSSPVIYMFMDVNFRRSVSKLFTSKTKSCLSSQKEPVNTAHQEVVISEVMVSSTAQQIV